jgi:hypothetical protein
MSERLAELTARGLEHAILGLRTVVDLEYHDGPLLSLLVNTRGDHFLYSWADTDGEVNRWLLFRVSDGQVIRYLTGEAALRDLILNPADDYVIVVDVDGAGVRTNVRQVTPADLPGDYLPEPGAFYHRIKGED